MQVATKKTHQVTLILDIQEAEWLKTAMQNPIHGEDVNDESLENAEMRMRFFLSINNVIKGN